MAKTLKKNTASEEKSGIYVYIGPSIRGVIQNGSIFAGTREEALKKNSAAIEFCSKIERLIVADSDIMSAKKKIKEGGNTVSLAYRAVVEKLTRKE
ncbi:MAG: hypothetical protein E7671_00550 [Ruminococcaceae bacterium]|nr:hypothetical protein [Oscillospiraceae bacterium]